MRCHAVFAAALISAAIALPASAADTPQQTAMKTCAANWKAMSAADKGKTKYQDYMGTCMKGGSAAPAASTAMTAKPAASMAMTAKPAASGAMSSSMKMDSAAGGSAKCKDGTTVTYKHRQGTCSGHGGVATWM